MKRPDLVLKRHVGHFEAVLVVAQLLQQRLRGADARVRGRFGIAGNGFQHAQSALFGVLLLQDLSMRLGTIRAPPLRTDQLNTIER